MAVSRIFILFFLTSSLATASEFSRCATVALGVEDLTRAEAMLEAAQQTLRPFQDQVTRIVEQTKIPVATMSFRVKSRESFLQKLGRTTLDQVFDLAAGRVVVISKDHVRTTAHAIGAGFSKATVETHVKKSGYEATHVDITLENGVKTEVQVTDLANYLWAQWEHDRIYKPSHPEDLTRRERLQVYGRELKFFLDKMVSGNRIALLPDGSGLLPFQLFDICQVHQFVTRPLPNECLGRVSGQ